MQIDAYAHDRHGVERGRPFARLVFAALDGLVLQQLFFGSSEETEAALEELRALLRPGI
jgi:hypothetical protein